MESIWTCLLSRIDGFSPRDQHTEIIMSAFFEQAWWRGPLASQLKHENLWRWKPWRGWCPLSESCWVRDPAEVCWRSTWWAPCLRCWGLSSAWSRLYAIPSPPATPWTQTWPSRWPEHPRLSSRTPWRNEKMWTRRKRKCWRRSWRSWLGALPSTRPSQKGPPVSGAQPIGCMPLNRLHA